MIYLSINFFVVSVPTVKHPRIVNMEGNHSELSGLEALRALLYDNFGWFLLLSTIVLLVALIGVAVITRNKK